jgi:hypothetical protein
LYGGFAWLQESLPKKANRCGGFPRDEKLGGFQPQFPLYPTKRLCAAAKGRAAQV